MQVLVKIKAEISYILVLLADFYVRIIRRRDAKRRLKEFECALRDPLTSQYCNHSIELMDHVVPNENNKILMDCFPIPVWIAANSVLVNCLSKRHKADICSYGETKRDPLTDSLYKSFFANSHLIARAPKTSQARLKDLFFKAIESIATSDDLFSWSIDGIQIGDEVYETYLRMFSRPTVNVGSIKCQYSIFYALQYYIFFEEFFKKNNVVACVLSHDIYISTGILAKMAWEHEVPVYLANGVELKKTTRADEKYSEFIHYREYFQSLNDSEKSLALQWGREQLEKRLGGQVGVNMAYSTKSAFTKSYIENQIARSDRIKVLIATHCFFDNPRAYGGMLFNDFYEWISYLGEISTVTDYDWYIKTHRDFLPGTVEALAELTNRYPKLKLINPETSWHQLREEGVSIILTCYGSVGHELPLLGFKVINAGYNPHVAYKFNWHAKSVADYKSILLNLETLGEIQELDSIYEFYFVHYKLSKQGGFLFDSYDEMCEYLKNPGVHSNEIFRRVLDGDGDLYLKGKRTINRFLDSARFSEAEVMMLGS